MANGVIPEGYAVFHRRDLIAPFLSAGDGTVLLEDLAPGEYRVRARHGQLESDEIRVEVKRRETTKADVFLRAATRD